MQCEIRCKSRLRGLNTVFRGVYPEPFALGPQAQGLRVPGPKPLVLWHLSCTTSTGPKDTGDQGWDEGLSQTAQLRYTLAAKEAKLY